MTGEMIAIKLMLMTMQFNMIQLNTLNQSAMQALGVSSHRIK